MPAVAAAYERHRDRITKLLGRLDENTWGTSRSLRQVANLYEENDASARTQMGGFSTRLDEI